MADQQRFTLLLDGPTVELVEGIQAAMNLRTKTAVFDMALNLLDWAVRQQQDGFEIGRYDATTEKFDTLLLPGRRTDALVTAAAERQKVKAKAKEKLETSEV